MNKPAVIALVITLLDAMGIGLIMPVLPSLLREYLPEADVANHYGILLALYAVMQVCFAPLLGRWSDKLGRRPVLLLSRRVPRLITHCWHCPMCCGCCISGGLSPGSLVPPARLRLR